MKKGFASSKKSFNEDDVQEFTSFYKFSIKTCNDHE